MDCCVSVLYLQAPPYIPLSSTRPGVAAPAAKENRTITHTHTHSHTFPLYLCWLIVTRKTRRFAFMRFINRGQATINSLLNSLTILNSFSPVTATSVTAGSWCLCLQVEEEATDKDNKNCSKDGMCGKVRLCLPLYNDSVIAWLDSSVSCFCGSKLVCLGCDFCCRIFSSC